MKLFCYLNIEVSFKLQKNDQRDLMKYLFILMLISGQLMAQTLCERSYDSQVINYLQDSTSRLSFKNRGGLFNGGVCWWHSRLQRASALLVEFKPELPPISAKEVPQLLKEIKLMKKVVQIKGFANFHSFSQVYQKEIQSLLEAWQREDGFLNQQWIRGVSGKYELESIAMKVRMDTLYDQFKKSPHPVWIMAQIKGIESHSFLLLKMQQKPDGYELLLIDSNFPLENKIIFYKPGDRWLKHPKDKYSFVPYLGFQKDFLSINSTLDHHCERNSWDSRDIILGEIEVGR
jgi:hypothetical protein